MRANSRPGARLIACLLGAAIGMTSLTPAVAQKKDKQAQDKGGDKKKEPSKADRKKARAAFEKAEDKLKSNDLQGALDAYREANTIIPAQAANYKIALVLDKMGKSADALVAYKKFLAEPVPEKLAEQKGLAEGRVAELSKGTIKLTIMPPASQAKLDGTALAQPLPATVSVAPGKHTVEVTAPNHDPQTREVDVPEGATVDVSIALQETPPSAPPPPPPTTSASAVASAPPQPPPEPKKSSKVPAYITLGLAGAGAIVGTIFGVQALSAKSDFEKKPTNDGADKAERNALIADMAFGVAITLGITGTVLLLSEPKKDDPPKAGSWATAPRTGSLKIAPVVTPQLQGAAMGMSF